MPNTLAHIGIQVVGSRALLRDADLRWVLVGCVVPDLPWIANRALLAAGVEIDVFVIRPYWIAQASWFGCLWLCAALAALSSRPRRVFGLLAANSFAHLLLDALQTKWGNGVHLFAPFSWETWNAGLFWPESGTTVALTVLGLAVAVFAAGSAWRGHARFHSPSARGWATATVLFAVYCTYPILAAPAVLSADAHSLATLQSPELRPGRQAGFDRVWLEVDADGARLHVLGGEVLEASGNVAARSGPVSARGRFRDARVIVLDEVHAHGSFPRAMASYVGLSCIAGILLVGYVGSVRGRRSDAGAGATPDVER